MDPRFLDHFEHPRHVGDLAAPSGTADVENPVCGDQLRLGLRIEQGRVAEVAYRVLGCSGAIAAASVMSELATGLALEQARRLDCEALDAALGGLPALKRHGADLAADGLQAALEDAARRAAEERP